ncbi:MAG: hypothetical protein ACLPJJ_13030 [Acidocella sp.]|uniref:hypothetical protein n=1 Tax=Acidocella sp. TaxID=50710 RepID=UPI003FD7F20E
MLTSVYADKHFSDSPRIPVWWGLDREVYLFATRRVGLAIFPLIGAAVLVFAAGRGVEFFHQVFISLGLLVVYLIYLQAVDKNLTQ